MKVIKGWGGYTQNNEFQKNVYLIVYLKFYLSVLGKIFLLWLVDIK